MPLKGFYIFGFKNTMTLKFNIKTIPHEKSLEPSYYIYIGSAFGPGGIFSRVSRHLKRDKRVKWHIDYLTNKSIIPLFVYSVLEDRKDFGECLIAKKLIEEKISKIAVKGFGSTDSPCLSHLLEITVSLTLFLHKLRQIFKKGGFLKLYPNL